MPYLLDGPPDADTTAVVHAVLRHSSVTEERELVTAAGELPRLLLTHAQLDWTEVKAWDLVAAPAHYSDPHVVGIIRPRYRVQTEMTAAWYAQIKQQSAYWLPRYQSAYLAGSWIEMAWANGPSAKTTAA